MIEAHAFRIEDFTAGSLHLAEIVYRAPFLIIRTNYNERDSFDICMTPLAYGDQSFSVGTLLAALDLRRPKRFADPLEIMSYQSQLLRSNMELLAEFPEDVVADCIALKFWHAADWRSRWGDSISLSQDEIQSERGRLRRLQAIFIKP